jgi:hypothetical protein
MESVGGSPETQFLSHGHEITQVTQLHNYLPSPAGKRFLPLRQELSNSGARIFAVTLRL